MKKFLKNIFLKIFIVSVFSLCIIQNLEAVEFVYMSSGDQYTVAITKDKEVYAFGDNKFGQCNVKNWTDIAAVSAGYMHTAGLKENGTVVACGNNVNNQCDVQDWTDIVAVSVGYDYTVGLKNDGTVVVTGNNDKGQCNVQEWADIDAISAGYDYTIGLKSDGTVVATGNNSKGQCNVQDWTDIIDVSAGYDYTLGLKKDGTVVATGNNDKGQILVSDWDKITAISAGKRDHSVCLKNDRTVVATGNNDKSQCNVGNWKNIVEISAGSSHTFGLDTKGDLVGKGYHGKDNCDFTAFPNSIIFFTEKMTRKGKFKKISDDIDNLAGDKVESIANKANTFLSNDTVKVLFPVFGIILVMFLMVYVIYAGSGRLDKKNVNGKRKTDVDKKADKIRDSVIK